MWLLILAIKAFAIVISITFLWVGIHCIAASNHP